MPKYRVTKTIEVAYEVWADSEVTACELSTLAFHPVDSKQVGVRAELAENQEP